MASFDGVQSQDYTPDVVVKVNNTVFVPITKAAIRTHQCALEQQPCFSYRLNKFQLEN
mgnify:CR=1 FL=1